MATSTDGQQAADTPDVSLEGAATALETLLFGADEDPKPNGGVPAASGTSSDQGAAGADDAQNSEGGDEPPADDAAPEETPPSGEDEPGENEPQDEAPAPIEAPVSWSKDAKEEWAKLPREAQQIIAARETARDAEVRRVQNEQAELAKVVETERQQRGQERDQYAKTLQHLSLLVMPDLARFQQLDWAKLAQEDPARYVAEQAARDGLMGRFGAVQGELQRIQQAQQAEQAQVQAQALQREKAKLIETVPEFADPSTAKEFANELSTWLAGKGFTPQEIGGISDHRMIMVARAAMQAERLAASQAAKTQQQTAAKVSAQTKKVPPTPAQTRVVKPSAVRPDQQDAEQRRVQEARNRLGKSGTVRDAAALLENFL